jgi:chitinase
MLDGQGCDGRGDHVLCCPVGNGVPSCGWYGHRNGNCEPSCPPDQVEVGSNNQHCNAMGLGFRKYQAACCAKTVGVGSHRVSPPNMRLHGQCGWGAWPGCDGLCASGLDTVALSFTGSGGAMCFGGRRSLCCNQPEDDWKWGTCYDNVPRDGADCSSDCPDTLVRVAMDSAGCQRGARSRCCAPIARTLSKRTSPLLNQYATALDRFMQSPTCPASYHIIGPIKRSLNSDSHFADEGTYVLANGTTGATCPLSSSSSLPTVLTTAQTGSSEFKKHHCRTADPNGYEGGRRTNG